MDEDRYEAIELLVKARVDGETWFDTIYDLIAKDCRGSEHDPCTCGLEHLGGTGGSLEQCWRHLDIADDLVTVNADDLQLVLHHLALRSGYTPQPLADAVTRLSKEITWWDDSLEDDDDEDEEHDVTGT